jgi:hypothetical protein
MALTLSGDGTIAGLAAGGLPDLSVGTGDIADAAITAAKMSGAQSGDAPIYGARAWVNFNGTGTVAIRGSGNVTSIIDSGVGDYTVNFTTAMSDANYCTNATGTHDSNSYVAWGTIANDQPPTTTSVNVDFLGTNGALTDVSFAQVSIFR